MLVQHSVSHVPLTMRADTVAGVRKRKLWMLEAVTAMAISQLSACAAHECRTQILRAAGDLSTHPKPRGVVHALQAGRNSQAQCCRGVRRFRGLCYWQRLGLKCRIAKECADRLRIDRHDHVVHLMRVCCAHIMLMTVYPNVVQIDNGRPLHVGAEQHHTNHEGLIGDVPVVHLVI